MIDKNISKIWRPRKPLEDNLSKDSHPKISFVFCWIFFKVWAAILNKNANRYGSKKEFVGLIEFYDWHTNNLIAPQDLSRFLL